MHRTLWLTTAPLLALAVSSAGHAQQAAPAVAGPVVRDGKTIYEAAYFAQYAPRTAYDIVQHVPGFQLDLGSTQTANGSVDVRGFAGTAGNVVFNGSRPTTKSETLDTTLQRIPAQRVIRVEVSSGDLYGSDYAGKSQVLNVVLSDAGGFDANVTADATRRYTGYIQGNLSGNVLIRKGPSTIGLSAGNQLNKQFEEGTDTLTNLGTGQLVEFRRKHNVYANRDPFIAGTYALEHGSNDAYHLNIRWQPSTFDLHQRNLVTPSNAPAHDDNLLQNYNDPRIEIGGDITRPLAGGAIKFVALETRRKRHDLDRYTQRNGLIEDGATVNGGFEQLINAQRNESIGRVSWTRANLFGFSFEAGAEGAYNTLKDNTAFSEIDENGNKVPIHLPIANAMVKEWRGEAYVSAGRTLSPNLRVDGGVNYEFSHLTVSGDATEDRRLKFLKPNLTVDWKPGGNWHAQASVRRTVAQLDFYDFISSADLSAQRVNGGNAGLQPQRTWEFRATVDHPLLGDGLFKLDLGHDQVSLLQDRILICDPDHPDNAALCFDAPGNIGTGKRDFAQLTLDVPLGRLWSGFRVKGGATLQRTRVDDPIDGKPRKWSGFYPAWQWNVDVRRDSGRWSYGFSVSDNQRFTFYRTDEFDTNFNGAPYWTAFIEYRPRANTTISLNFDNITEASGDRDRTLFRPNRADPQLIFDEFRERNRHKSVGLTLKQSFGGGGGTAVAKSN
jgi:TonB-dependent Receptor Plug Domain